MRRVLGVFLALSLATPGVSAQATFTTRNGQIRFNASTPLEDIEAENRQVNAILRPETGAFGVVLLISGFEFPRRLMQEHFNENYLESERYPKATFSGAVSGPGLPEGGGACECHIEGTLTIHGVGRPLQTPARVTRGEGGFRVQVAFTIRPEDHGVEIPKLLFRKIAEEVQVEVDLLLQPGGGASGSG